jgi:hypothetical protein
MRADSASRNKNQDDNFLGEQGDIEDYESSEEASVSDTFDDFDSLETMQEEILDDETKTFNIACEDSVDISELQQPQITENSNIDKMMTPDDWAAVLALVQKYNSKIPKAKRWYK